VNGFGSFVYWKLVLEVDNEYECLVGTKQLIPEKLSQFGKGVVLSIQQSKQGVLIGAYHPPSQKFEIYDPQLSKFPLFIYQLIPSIERIFSTDKFTFVVKTEDNTSKISVISNYIAATSTSNPRVGLTKNQRESIMQEFSLPNGQEVCGMYKSFGTNEGEIEGFLVWTQNSIYECRSEENVEEMFEELVTLGLEKLAEPLGKSLSLDLLFLYEKQADIHFSRSQFGRALE